MSKFLIARNTVSVSGSKEMSDADTEKVIEAIETFDFSELLKNHLKNQGIDISKLEIENQEN